MYRGFFATHFSSIPNDLIFSEQQNWIELPVDTAFYIGRDLMKAKLVEIARSMMDTGNYQLLPEFTRKYDVSYGEDLLRRIGSTPSYSQIISKYKQERDLTRHAGYGGRNNDHMAESDDLEDIAENESQEDDLDNVVEINGQEVGLDDIAFDLQQADFNNSFELNEVSSSFNQPLSEESPADDLSSLQGLSNEDPAVVTDSIHEQVPQSSTGTEEVPSSITTLDVTNNVAFEESNSLEESVLEQIDELSPDNNIGKETLASLVPDYELTPSPARCQEELNISSGSPMLRLSPSPSPHSFPTTRERFSPSSPLLRVPSQPGSNYSAGATHHVEVGPPVAPMPFVEVSPPVRSSPLGEVGPPVGSRPLVEAGLPVETDLPVEAGLSAVGALHPVTPSSIPKPAEVAHLKTPSVIRHITEDDYIPVTPSSSTGPDLDVISYVPHLDTYFSPGRLFPIGVQISKNLCSQCGVCRPTKWCSHLKNAALKAGIPVKNTPVYMRSLTQLRRNQRADKSKSGRKAPRKFDVLQIHELNSQEESQEIQLELASLISPMPTSTVEDTIEAVIQAGIENTLAQNVNNDDINTSERHEDEKLWCICKKPSSGEMIGCDNPDCKVEWFHFECMHIRRAPKGDWFCIECRSGNSTKRKLTFGDENLKKPKKQKKTIKRVKCPECENLLAASYLKNHMKKFCLGIK